MTFQIVRAVENHLLTPLLTKENTIADTVVESFALSASPNWCPVAHRDGLLKSVM